MKKNRCCLTIVLGAMLAAVLGGCAAHSERPDPWEKTNRDFYKFNDRMDKYAFKPAADAYVKVVPEPVRTGLGHAYDNLDYANVWINDFLQGKWQRGWSDTGRMAVNSTVGVAGILDVASKWGMVSHDTDFGITLGKWGVKPGPYMVLPLFGPSSLRDSSSVPVGIVTDPLTWVDMPFAATAGLYAAQAIDERARMDVQARFRDNAAIDPYVFTRDAYLQYRENQLREGAATQPTGLYDEPDSDTTNPANDSTQPASTVPAVTAPTATTRPVTE